MSKEAWYAAVIGAIFGGIISIPLQIGTGLLFPRVQRWFDLRTKAKAFAKSTRMQKDFEEAHYFVTYPHKMTQYFLNRGLELFRLSLFLFIGWGGLLWGPVKITSGTWGNISWLVAIGGLAFLLFVISQSVNNLHEIYYRVEFWGDYKKKVALELPDVVAGTGSQINQDARRATDRWGDYSSVVQAAPYISQQLSVLCRIATPLRLAVPSR